MSDLIVSLRLAWCVVVRNWVVYRKDFLANISPTLADPALMMTALGMGLSPFIGNIHGLSYSPMYFLSGTFFPIEDRPILGTIVQISPFFHGVSLLQMAAWNQFSPAGIAYHLGVILAYGLILGLWSLVRIRRKLIN
jgi:ABC-type multidrug transport system permease subunit